MAPSSLCTSVEMLAALPPPTSDELPIVVAQKLATRQHFGGLLVLKPLPLVA